MTRTPRRAARELTAAQQRQLHEDALTQAMSWGRLLRVWMTTLADAVEQVAREGEAAPFAARAFMWIRLYGAIGEVLPGLKAAHEKFLGFEKRLPDAEDVREGTRHLAMCHDATARVRDALSTDELLFVAFARHHEAHPFPTLDVTQLRRGVLVEKRTVLGSEHDIREIREACSRVMLTHGMSDARVAAHIAGRTLPLVKAAAAACAGDGGPLP